MLLAFLLNATAFPQFDTLLPVVAKEVYHGDQILLASAACGAPLDGSMRTDCSRSARAITRGTLPGRAA